MLDYRRLEAFCKVYELRSFSRAGEDLFLSQPTISAHVLALEKTLGVQLFDRLGRSVLPTVAGDVLYRHGIRAFECLELAQSELASLRNEVSGELAIGGSTIPANYILPEVMGEFLRAYPSVRPQLRVGDTENVIQMVANGEVLVGVVGDVRVETDLVFEPVYDDELVVIASPTLHDISGPVPAAYLASLRWVMREHGSGTRSVFLAAIEAAGVNWRSLEIALTVGSTEAVIQYVRAGLGVGVTSRIAVAAALERGELVELVLLDCHPVRQFQCVRHARRTFFPAAAAFIESLRNWMPHSV